MNLILADVVGAELIRRTVEVGGEVFNRVDVGPHGVRRVVATLEFIQHPLA